MDSSGANPHRRAVSPPRFFFASALCGAVLISAPTNATPIGVVTIGDSIPFGVSSQPTGAGWVDILADQLSPDYLFTNIA